MEGGWFLWLPRREKWATAGRVGGQAAIAVLAGEGREELLERGRGVAGRFQTHAHLHHPGVWRRWLYPGHLPRSYDPRDFLTGCSGDRRHNHGARG